MAIDINKFTLNELVSEIKRHNNLYWDENSSEISDEDYDLLMQRLEEIDPSNELLNFIGQVNYKSKGVILDDPMISLEKTYYFKDAPKGKKSLLQWVEDISRSDNEIFLIQPKYDGISACFSNGMLASRGQGSEDENISDKIPLIELESIRYKGKIDRDVRGEIVIRNDDFINIYSTITRSDGSNYKNQRNAVAGIVGLKDFTDIQKQGAKLTLVDYLLNSFKVAKNEFVSKWEEVLSEIESLPYPMDGVVVKLFDNEYSRSLGSTAHHPRGQIAFKFSGVRKKSKIISIDWSFGKNCLTPIARIEGIEIGGVTIRNVTLHNLANIETNDIQIGDYVIVERAGDVIPHVVSREKGTDRISAIIDKCPSCNSTLIRDSKELRCNNPNCFESMLQKILASVRNIGIEELGEPNLRKMMINLNTKSLRDIFNLRVSDILKLDGFKIKSATNLYNNIQKAKNTQDFALLASLNISGFGKNIAEKILKDYTIEELRQKSKDDLACIPDIAVELSSNLYNSLKEQSETIDEIIKVLNIIPTKIEKDPYSLVAFDQEVMTEMPSKELLNANSYARIKVLRENGNYLIPKELRFFVTDRDLDSGNKLKTALDMNNVIILKSREFIQNLKKTTLPKMKKICFTGAMTRPRSFYDGIAIKNGYKVVDSIVKDLDLLVISDISLNSTKLTKAKELGIKVKVLEDWLEDVDYTLENSKEHESYENDDDDGFLPGFNI